MMKSVMEKVIGTHVIYIDDTRNEHDALVENNWGSELSNQPTINLIYIEEANGVDQYGAQKKHATSIVHISKNDARANCWKLPTE